MTTTPIELSQDIPFGDGIILAPIFKFQIGAPSLRLPYSPQRDHTFNSQAYSNQINVPWHYSRSIPRAKKSDSNSIFALKGQQGLTYYDGFNGINDKQEFSLEGRITQENIKREESEVSFGATNGKEWKGLRLLSYKVKNIIRDKKDTTYKQVAEQLENEMKRCHNFQNEQKKDKEVKNVRRRVYDALNVLIAADVIVKKAKTLEATELTQQHGKCLSKDRWQEYSDNEQRLVCDQKEKRKQLAMKRQFVEQWHARFKALDQLFERNKQQSEKSPLPEWNLIHFPITLVKTQEAETILQFGKENKTLRILSNKPFELLSDVELVNKLFKK